MNTNYTYSIEKYNKKGTKPMCISYTGLAQRFIVAQGPKPIKP